jgi:hypothetical protein
MISIKSIAPAYRRKGTSPESKANRRIALIRLKTHGMKFVVQLSGRGWADAFLENDQQHLKADISYLSDGIGEMADAAVAILKGERSTKFSFQDEPGEHVFVLTRGKDDQLNIQVFENFKTFEGRLKNSVLKIDCAVLDFVGQVFSSLAAMQRNEGDAYKERWGYDFPKPAFDFLSKSF